jgi:uncharacterized repeat protein (TIGR03803 family)
MKPTTFVQGFRTSAATPCLAKGAIRTPRSLTHLGCLMAALLAIPLFAPAAHGDTILHNFTGPAGDGSTSYSTLVSDSNGNLYGTTANGGINKLGTAFVLCAPGAAGPAPCNPSLPPWQEIVLYNFQGISTGDGANPYSTLIFGGNYAGRAFTLYGTTYNGGNANACGGAGCGTVFELCAPAAAGGCGGASWTEHVLYQFKGGKDGANPFAGVIEDKANNLYGTTVYGGGMGVCKNGSGINIFCGTAYKLKRPAGWLPFWPEKILHRFGAAGDGSNPYGALCCNSSSAIAVLYGTTELGGATGQGTVFKLKNASPFPYIWLYSFNGADGEQPYDNVVLDSSGTVYGTASSGGAFGHGVIFGLPQPPPAAVAPLYSFCISAGCPDGARPTAGLTLNGGNLFGTTYNGGNPLLGCGGSGCGTVFAFTPPAGPLSPLNDFFGAPADGAFPWGGIVTDPVAPGAWFGTTTSGGAVGGFGVSYRIP